MSDLSFRLSWPVIQVIIASVAKQSRTRNAGMLYEIATSLRSSRWHTKRPSYVSLRAPEGRGNLKRLSP